MVARPNAKRFLGPLLGLCLLVPSPLRSQEPDPVVHALLFYSPTCPHCHEVITTFLIPLQEEFGNRLVILGLDTSQPWANEIFWAALREYEVPEDKWAVPFMIVDETILVGGFEIPGQFRTILEEGLESGGIDLPNLEALLTFMADQNLLDTRYPDRRIARQSQPEAEAAQDTPEEAPTPTADSMPSVADTLEVAGPEEELPAPSPAESDSSPSEVGGGEPGGDPRGGEVPDSVATGREPPVETEGEGGGSPSRPGGTPVVPPETTVAESSSGSNPSPLGLAEAARELESMTMWDRFQQDRRGNSLSVLVLLGMILSVILRGVPGKGGGRLWPTWVVPALVLLGVGVASYLSYIEITHAEAVCGPVGDCNTVNQSSYATLFGFLPVGVLGLMGYGVVLALWALGRLGPEALRPRADLGLWGAALFGTLFSIYLTFLEPFVIGATCAWCLTSAVIMTLLLWASAPLAARARKGGESP